MGASNPLCDYRRYGKGRNRMFGEGEVESASQSESERGIASAGRLSGGWSEVN